MEAISYHESSILLKQGSNGIPWRLATTNETIQQIAEDCATIRRSHTSGGIVFLAHSLLHGFPWSVMDSIANTHVLSAIKKQPFRWYKAADSGLYTTIERIRHAAQASAWQAAALKQTPANIWAHHNQPTEYQVWVL